MQAIERRVASPRAKEHIEPMATRSNIDNAERRLPLKGARPGYYRGVKIGKPPMPPARPIEEIRDAVRSAFAKHPELLSSS